MLVRLALTVGLLCAGGVVLPAAQSSVPTNSPTLALRVATFDVDATPPVGSMMAYDPVTNHWELGLRARGIVLLGAGEPIVLCAVDWIGIANEGHDVFCRALARAAATSPRRVAVHSLHQHDAPDCDFSAERILKEAGVDPRQYEGRFQRQVIADLERAVRESLPRAQPVTHLGLGEARVDQVASNRRILGPDGKVRATRWTATKAPAIRAESEGTIDPILSFVSLWNGERPLAVLSYYATLPQSYYPTTAPGCPIPTSRGWPVSCANWPSLPPCTFTSTEQAATSARASTMTARRRTVWRWPNGWRMECAALGKVRSASRSAPLTWVGRSNPWRYRPPNISPPRGWNPT